MPVKTPTKPTTAKPARKKKLAKQYVAIVIDESGSMGHITTQAVKLFNDAVTEIAKQAKETGIETFVSAFKFSNFATELYSNSPAATARHMHVGNYGYNRDKLSFLANGMTALLDAVGAATVNLQNISRTDKDAAFLVVVVTDGGENMSRTFTPAKIKDLLIETQKTGRWSFTFQVPPGAATALSNQFGVPLDNIREWEGTAQGATGAAVALGQSLGNYYGERSTGALRTQSFYVETDLSKVKTKDIVTKLDDISDRFKAYTLAKDAVAKEFVESKTKKDLVVGQLYYQLFKSERVQPNKAVVIQEKGKKAIWGGKAARDLIGLPSNQEAKVIPGNHSNYDIYVQSGSINRKLPRGTKVLIDIKQTKDIAKTWDWTQPAGASK